MPASRRYYLALGSNLGDTLARLAEALDGLAELACGPLRASSVTLSPPCDGSEQPDYANLCCELPSELGPLELLDATQAIERRMGRPVERTRWSARVIDIDLILTDRPADADSRAFPRSDRLEIPHPRYRERLFVVQPMAELVPELRDPQSGESMATLLARLTDDGALPLLPLIAPARTVLRRGAGPRQ